MRLRRPFVTIASTALLAAGCSESPPPTNAAADARVSCDEVRFGNACTEEGRECDDPCRGNGPYFDLVCKDGKWTSKPNGNCNPPGWPYYDSGTQPDTMSHDAEPEAELLDTLAPDATTDG